MTMHKAKGLEFPVVVLPHVCRDSFPGGKGSERWTAFAHVVPSELRDDRHVLPVLAGYTSKEVAAFVESCRRHDRTGDDRLAYVGVTRAKQVLIATGHWWGPTQKNARGPSEYLEALREQATGEGDGPVGGRARRRPGGSAERRRGATGRAASGEAGGARAATGDAGGAPTGTPGRPAGTASRRSEDLPTRCWSRSSRSRGRRPTGRQGRGSSVPRER